MRKLLSVKCNKKNVIKFKFVKYFTTKKTENVDLEDYLNDFKTDESKSWSYYIKGINPDYEPRQDMYKFLTSKNINVHRMTVYEIECFTKFLMMRKKYGDKFPQFPYEITLDDKIQELQEKYPLH
ncbi:conserved protein, unknown function [Hepatocystis sp. ex Piliocolobus tephrosceles]|nr:conserved protein, unknown function [Hepatocystis sp. ex Piliocolobus tephrosceles]